MIRIRSIRIRSRCTKSGVDMTPIIDVVFILLIFFVLAASYAVRGIDMELPAAQSAQAAAGRIVPIRLTKTGGYVIDDVPVSRADLPYALSNAVRSFKTRPGRFVLFAAPDAPVEALIHLVDQVRRNGGETLMVATRPPEAAP